MPRTRLPLAEGWKLQGGPPGTFAGAQLSMPGLDVADWLDARAPGDVNAILIAAGRMPDYRIGDHAKECFWVTSREWCWRLEFDAPADSSGPVTQLCLDGVDGVATVWLNGRRVGDCVNAFFPYRFDVTDRLARGGRNALVVIFKAVEEIMGAPRHDPARGWEGVRTKMRKAQFSFGWDWSLPLPGIGFTAPAFLETHEGISLKSLYFDAKLDGRVDVYFMTSFLPAIPRRACEARIRIKGHGFDETRRLRESAATAELRATVEGGESEEAPLVTTISKKHYLSFFIPDPKWWWPRDYGEQALYEYEVAVFCDGHEVDRKAGRFGIRQVRVFEEPFMTADGRRTGLSFGFEINGVKVFCKGANWIPCEMFPGEVTDEQRRFYLGKAAEANFNMLRVWGGGVYERDLFYDLCDELGIMVWQDFMNVNSILELDRLRKNILAEAEFQVRRLRNHPCIAIWCGCNEDAFWSGIPERHWQPGEPEPYERDRETRRAVAKAYYGLDKPDTVHSVWLRARLDVELYNYLLRGVVGRLAPGAPYTESSPHGHDDGGNAPHSGTAHLSSWKWCLFESEGHPERFRKHFDTIVSFDSEFCIQGPCSVASFRKFMPKDHLWPPDDMWTFHIQRGHANLPHHEQTLRIAEPCFGKIDSLETYVKHGQAVHVEQMRAEYESARRDKFRCGGTMVWMFQDCWPTSNWSLIDYYRAPKPAYYAAKRACAKWLPVIAERMGRIEFFFCNDSCEGAAADLAFGQERLDGTRVWTKTARVECLNSAEKFFVLPKAEWSGAAGDYLFIDATVNGLALDRVTFFPGLWRDVPWPLPNIAVNVTKRECKDGLHRAWIEVSTDAFARFCFLQVKPSCESAWFSDNFFDLCAGGRKTVLLIAPREIAGNEIAPGCWHSPWP